MALSTKVLLPARPMLRKIQQRNYWNTRSVRLKREPTNACVKNVRKPVRGAVVEAYDLLQKGVQEIYPRLIVGLPLKRAGMEKELFTLFRQST